MTPKLALRTPTDLLAAVPYLLGFHPADSLVLLGLRGSHVAFQARADLAEPADALAEHLAGLFIRQGFGTALLVGYGPADRVDPLVRPLRERLTGVGVRTPEALRVNAGRYWSYTCAKTTCCPPEGTAYAMEQSPVAVEATVAGMVALPSRTVLCDELAPVTGAAREAMRRATALAQQRATALVDTALAAAQSDGGEAEPAGHEALHRMGTAVIGAARRRFEDAGKLAVDHAVAVYRAGGSLDDDAAAWLCQLLVHVPVRDYAWDRIGEDFEPHLALWRDLTRRAEPDLRAAPATLLAFTAWRSGAGATTTIALDLAAQADPRYPMAHLLARAVTAGVDPALWRVVEERRERRGRRRRVP